MNRKRDMVVAAAHGILTRQTDPSWTDFFEVWMQFKDHAFFVEKKEYLAGPFPAWNVWLKNYYLAYSLAVELELYAKRGVLIGMVGHSNGCDIELKTMRILARRGIRTEIIILIGGAAESDVAKNGVDELIGAGMLGKAIAWSSEKDLATASPLIWPYGRLGHTGWTFQGKPYSAEKVVTQWHDCGHSEYLNEEHRNATFEEVYRELVFARETAPGFIPKPQRARRAA